MTEAMTTQDTSTEALPVETAAMSFGQRTGEQLVTLHSVPDPHAPAPEPTPEPAVTEETTTASTEDGAVDVREQARTAWRESVTTGEPLTGLELGERFDRSERWGRARIAEARHDSTGTDGTSAATVPARSHRAGKRGTENARAVRQSADGTPAHGTPPVADDGRRAVAAKGVRDVPAQSPNVSTAVPVPDVPVRVPGGARLVAWAGFAFGTVISVAANVLHAWLPTLAHEAPTPGLAPQIGAAVWPIALVISVEVLSRVPWRPGWTWQVARYGGAGVVALGAAVISYGHLHGVLAAWDYGTTGAAVGPLVIDGLMTISGFALLAMSDHGKAASR